MHDYTIPFVSKAATRPVIVCTLLNDLEFFIDRNLRASKSSFRKLINTFSFFPRNNGRGDLTSGLA